MTILQDSNGELNIPLAQALVEHSRLREASTISEEELVEMALEKYPGLIPVRLLPWWNLHNGNWLRDEEAFHTKPLEPKLAQKEKGNPMTDYPDPQIETEEEDLGAGEATEVEQLRKALNDAVKENEELRARNRYYQSVIFQALPEEEESEKVQRLRQEKEILMDNLAQVSEGYRLLLEAELAAVDKMIRQWRLPTGGVGVGEATSTTPLDKQLGGGFLGR